jgi:HEAT repeat protein
MELKHWQWAKGGWGQRWLRWVNLRPEESERTFLMFAFYTVTSVGLLWLEASTVGLFLDRYGAESLPLIYLVGAAIGSGLGALYSWLQQILPLRRTIVLIAVLMSLPLLLFRVGLGLSALFGITIFLMRLWVDGIYVLNDLNSSIAANQLFNIREIKRTYPLISSGILLADVISGFSLPVLIRWFGLANITLISCVMMLLGALVLFYLTQSYSQAFPDSSRRTVEDDHQEFTTRRLQGPLRSYVWPLIVLFVLVEVLYILIDFQFLSALELQQQTPDGNTPATAVASFLGLFNGILGIFELVTQWFASSRIVERMGVFAAGSLLPGLVAFLGTMSLFGASLTWFPLFVGLVAIKFFDELLHYTLIEGTGPVLFQPLPDNLRSNFQALVNGIAEPFASGVTGVGIWAIIWCGRQWLPAEQWQELQGPVFVWLIVALALAWIVVIWLMRARYVDLLVSSAERGRLSGPDVDLRGLKRAVVETLQTPGTEADKRSCIELLSQIDPQNVGEVLASLLPTLPPSLQRQSLETMLQHPSREHLDQVRLLINQSLPPEVLALALRYVWLTEAAPDVQQLRPYLRPEVDPVVRGTAAALILRRGNRDLKVEATHALRRMITHKQEKERVMGTRALGEADYLAQLRLYIPSLLQDESLRVRCALLEVIASTHLEEYYPSLLRGLYYKSTRESAMRALVRLENEAIAPLVHLAEDNHKPDLVRMHAWNAIGQIGSQEALDALVTHLLTSWGIDRRNILRVLLKIPQERGIDGVQERIGRSGIERTIDQELMFLGQTYAASIDFSVATGLSYPERDGEGEVPSYSALQLLQRALRDLQTDAIDRLFLLMKLLYPLGSIQAAAFNLKSGSPTNMARGLEILDNTIDIPNKRALLSVLDQHSENEKLDNLSELVNYQRCGPSDRLRYLLELRHFLSDWPLACCFHLARQARWSVSAEATLAGLRHPRGFVREAVLAYLRVASPRALVELLPRLKNDPDRLVAAQVEEMMQQFGLSHSTA